LAIDKRVISVLDGSSGTDFLDRLFFGKQVGISNVAGSGPGASVSTIVTFQEPLPDSYTVLVQPGQAATWFISNKTVFGFTVTLVPLSGETLALGSFDVVLLG
jgi:hypothetical protein